MGFGFGARVALGFGMLILGGIILFGILTQPIPAWQRQLIDPLFVFGPLGFFAICVYAERRNKRRMWLTVVMSVLLYLGYVYMVIGVSNFMGVFEAGTRLQK